MSDEPVIEFNDLVYGGELSRDALARIAENLQRKGFEIDERLQQAIREELFNRYEVRVYLGSFTTVVEARDEEQAESAAVQWARGDSMLDEANPYSKRGDTRQVPDDTVAQVNHMGETHEDEL